MRSKKRRNVNPFLMLILILLCGGAGGLLFGILQEKTKFLNLAGKGSEDLLRYIAASYLPMMFEK
ncbi:MAG: hypothetical protein MR332_12135 [Fusicatenibacter sp.]|nr:hypothetical protein [Fusicatenibacter sp.]